MSPHPNCDAILPLLPAYDEAELDQGERAAVERHLIACRACRVELVAERALTNRLGRPARRRALPAGLSAAALVLLALGALLAITTSGGRAEAFGAIETRRLALDLTESVGPVESLARTNHLDVPTGETRRVLIDGLGELRVEGPATLELDATERGWKLILLRGEVEANVAAGGLLQAVTAGGARRLPGGVWRLVAQAAPAPAPVPAPRPADPTPAELVDQGHRAFQNESMETAEARYRAVLGHPDATATQKTQAGFYLFAAVARQGRLDDAIAIGEAWVRDHPADDSRHYVLYFLGFHHAELGHDEAARAAWKRVVDEAPASNLADLARGHLEGRAPRAAQRHRPYEPRRLLPLEPEGGGGVAVVGVGLGDSPEHRRFAALAKAIAEHHRAPLIDVPDPADLSGLERALRRGRPKSVVVVVPPETLDVALHRRILLLSVAIDEDVFADFAFGYLTARDAESAAALWARTQVLRAEGLAAKTWISTAVTSGPRCLESAGSVPTAARAAGFTGTSLHWAFPAKDEGAWTFIERNLPRLETAGVITMTGNGDPEGIWLFDDHRNADRTKHWDYAPEKVGHDPDGAMPRLAADRFRALKLRRPIVWSGTCHSGAVDRVFVEGDIVSTFGRTDRTTLHRLPPDRSLALALLDAGAAALLVPIGANHGMSVSRETEVALTTGASLGESIKSTYDDVALAATGRLVLDLPVDGEPHRSREPVMQGGGANRVLIGDPTLRPFEKTEHPLEHVTARRRNDGGFDVIVRWTKGWHPWAWDMFGLDRARADRVFARVPIDGLVPADRAVRLSATVTVLDGAGRVLPFVLTRAEPEVFHGRRYLHLQANVSREAVNLRETDVVATFRVTVE